MKYLVKIFAQSKICLALCVDFSSTDAPSQISDLINFTQEKQQANSMG